MYPIERCMKIFKGYVKNPYRLEVSIIERYIAEEAIDEETSQFVQNREDPLDRFDFI